MNTSPRSTVTVKSSNPATGTVPVTSGSAGDREDAHPLRNRQPRTRPKNELRTWIELPRTSMVGNHRRLWTTAIRSCSPISLRIVVDIITLLRQTLDEPWAPRKPLQLWESGVYSARKVRIPAIGGRFAQTVANLLRQRGELLEDVGGLLRILLDREQDLDHLRLEQKRDEDGEPRHRVAEPLHELFRRSRNDGSGESDWRDQENDHQDEPRSYAHHLRQPAQQPEALL